MRLQRRPLEIACLWSLALWTTAPEVVGRGGFVFGINGHPLMQAAYSYEVSGADEQFQLLHKLRIRWYRVDVMPDSTGLVDAGVIDLARAAKRQGINLLPVLTVRPQPAVTAVAAYAQGLGIGRGFASRYRSWFSHIEAGNELDTWPLGSGPGGDGSTLTQYNPDTLAVVTAFLRGLSRGLKTAAPEVQVIINSAGWRHYAFFDALERDTVAYDIVGYHWFSDMGDIDLPVDSGPSVLDHLNRIGKDIWMTEVGRRGTVPDDPFDQGRRIGKYVSDFYRFRQVKALFVYELYEQRDFLLNSDPRDDAEAFYGIIACPDDPSSCRGRKRPKPAFDVYRRAIEDLSRR
jgi:hypothetical protein